MFDGALGKYTSSTYKIELKENIKPYHAKPFPIPKVHEPTLKKEVERLVKIGVLRKLIIVNGRHPPLLYLRRMVLYDLYRTFAN